MYSIIARIYPYKMRENTKQLLTAAGVKLKADKFLTLILLLSIFLSALCSFIAYKLLKLGTNYVIIVSIALFIAFQLFFNINLVLKADSRAKFIETILPDALQLTASNLKAGFTVERALILSARPEFGAFSEDLTIIGREIATGKDIEEALLNVTKRIKSEKLSKAVGLIVQGVRSGGELAILLSQTAQNLRSQMLVEERMRASAMSYFIFILSAVAFASPLLFALSSFLAEVIKKQISSIQIPVGLSIPISVNVIPLGGEFIMGFIIITLTTLGIFGSLALGFIKRGSIKEGLRYMPMILGFSLGMFFIVRAIIHNVFAGLIG